jgi:hypothetical protein
MAGLDRQLNLLGAYDYAQLSMSFSSVSNVPFFYLILVPFVPVLQSPLVQLIYLRLLLRQNNVHQEILFSQ